jgi:hypothetical protein
MKIWKLLSAFGLHGILFIGVPYGLDKYGMVSPLRPQAYIVLFITWVGLGLKLLFGDVITDKFEYHKHGYDFCIVSMGALLSTLSLQLLTDKDLLPGIQTTGPFGVFGVLSPNIVIQRATMLTALFLLSCFSALLTARVSRAIGDPSTQGKNLLSLLNMFVGVVVFATYLLLLISKG